MLAHVSCISRGGQDPDTEPSHGVQGRGQENDKRRTRPGHKSPATEFRGTAKRMTRGAQEEDKTRTQSPATEFRGTASECDQLSFCISYIGYL